MWAWGTSVLCAQSKLWLKALAIHVKEKKNNGEGVWEVSYQEIYNFAQQFKIINSISIFFPTHTSIAHVYAMAWELPVIVQSHSWNKLIELSVNAYVFTGGVSTIFLGFFI